MSTKDYYKIVFAILRELFCCKEEGKRVDIRTISADRFDIAPSYLISILSDMLDEGYIRGFEIIETKTGRIVDGYGNTEITMKGIEYLQENTIMKKIYKNLKEFRDWIPVIK